MPPIHRFNWYAVGYIRRFPRMFLFIILLGSACSGIRSYSRFTLDQKHLRMQRVIESYLYTPYRWGGEDETGVDCSGLVVVVYRQALGISLPHSTEELFNMGQKVAFGQLRYGDLVFFAEGGGGPTHVGISLGGERFVHAGSESGVVVATLKSSYFRKRFICARRLRL